MKIIKILITISIINTLFVMALVDYVSKRPQPTPAQLTTQTSLDIQTLTKSIEPTPTVPSATKAPAASKKPSTTTKPKSSTAQSATPKPSTTTATSTPQASSAPVATPTPKPVVTGCVIKIDGVSYEITALRRSHSGGDIFTCNSDMSAIFWGKHNAKILAKMTQYKI